MIKSEEKKTTVAAVKAEAPKAAEPAKKAAAKKAEPKVAKKPAAKKTATAAKAEDVVVLQLGGAEWNMADIKAKVLAAAGKKTAKKVELYVKPEDGKVYFVVDGQDGAVEL